MVTIRDIVTTVISIGAVVMALAITYILIGKESK